MIVPYLYCCIFILLLPINSIANTTEKCGIMRKFPLKGLMPPVFTPMDKRGQVNVSVVPAYAKYLKMKSAVGVLVAGTSGEGPNMSVSEKKKLFEAWMKEARALGLSVVAQVGGVPVPDMVTLAGYVEKLKVDVILVLPPVYYKPNTPKDLTTIMEMVSAAAPSTPIMYYDYPDMSGVKVDMPTFFEMASKKIPKFVGLKAELSTALSVKASTDLRPDQGFGIANYQLILESVAMGMDAYFTTLANVCPEMVMEVMNCTKSGDMMGAKKAQEKLNKLAAKITEADYVSGLRAATEMVTGLKLGNPRPPLPTLSSEELLKIKAALKDNNIEVILDVGL